MQRRSLASLHYYKRWSSLLLLLLKYFAFPPSFHLIVSVLIVTPILAKLVFLCDPKGLPWVWFLRPGTPGSMRVTVLVSSPAIVGAAHLLLPSCSSSRAALPPPKVETDVQKHAIGKKMGWPWLKSWLNHPQGGKVCKEKGLHLQLPKWVKQRVRPWLCCSAAGLGGCVAAALSCNQMQRHWEIIELAGCLDHFVFFAFSCC